MRLTKPASHGRRNGVRSADSHDLIGVVGARVNNLKDNSIELSKRRLTAFTGVCGSGSNGAAA